MRGVKTRFHSRLSLSGNNRPGLNAADTGRHFLRPRLRGAFHIPLRQRRSQPKGGASLYRGQNATSPHHSHIHTPLYYHTPPPRVKHRGGKLQLTPLFPSGVCCEHKKPLTISGQRFFAGVRLRRCLNWAAEGWRAYQLGSVSLFVQSSTSLPFTRVQS